MRFLYLSVFTCLLFNSVAAQSYKKDFLTHKVTVHFPDHNVVAHVNPVKGSSYDSDKLYYWFTSGRIQSTQGGYSGKLLNGGYEDFYNDKTLKETGYFNKGLKAGTWKAWDSAGFLKEEYTWSKGKKNGPYHKYDASGKLEETGRYRNDLLQGTQKIFKADTLQTAFYKKGKVAERKSIVPEFIRRMFKKK